MDSSTNPSMNGAQHSNNPPYGFLDGIQSFAGADTLQNADDYSQFFDPALFETTTLGHGFAQQQQQQQQAMSQNFDTNGSRQSNSPGVPQYNPQPQSFAHHQYAQPMYDSRQIAQPNYDPRFYSRPSPSPVGFDGGYPYQQMGYGTQNFNSPHMNLPQQQTPTPTPNYAPRQQQPSPYVNIGPRPPQLSQQAQVTNSLPLHLSVTY
jgi:hypothetical protein